MNNSKITKVELVQKTYEALNELYARSQKAGLPTACSEGRYHPEICFDLVVRLQGARDYFAKLRDGAALEQIPDAHLEAAYNDLQKALDPVWGGNLEDCIQKYAHSLSSAKGRKDAQSGIEPPDCITQALRALNYIDMIKKQFTKEGL